MANDREFETLDEVEKRHAQQVRDLQSRYEQEIQELDEAEIVENADTKIRVLDRLIPGNERRRTENYADARAAAFDANNYSMIELNAQQDYESEGPEETTNEELLADFKEPEWTSEELLEDFNKESEPKELDLERD